MQTIYGHVVSFTGDPYSMMENVPVTSISDGAVCIDDEGKIAFVGERSDIPEAYNTALVHDHRDKLVLPGFVDAHLHFPQYRMIAAYGKDLLDWLNRYTFIEEQRYGDTDIAASAASFFLDELARNGTTSCLAFSTIHTTALECLFEEAERRNMALISGKTMMDRNAPPGLRDTAQSGYDDSRAMIEKWHGRDRANGRLGYAITPRFAVTSSEAQLEASGTLVREFPDLIMQTHLSESAGEIAAVASDFPWAKDYTDVYDRFGLLGPKSFFAHGIHLSPRELARLSESRSSIVHCPTSNNFLGSGLYKWADTARGDQPVQTAMGSDIGGGTSYSMLATMRDAYVVSQLVGKRMSAFDAFHMATRGNANLLGMGDSAGTLEPGKFADIAILDPRATPVMAARDALSETLHDRLFALMMMGDDRAVTQTWIAGKPMKPEKTEG